jgi:hypothetical protein
MPQSQSPLLKREQYQKKPGRPPPIALPSAANLIQVQKQIKGMAKQSFEFHTT